MEEVNTLMRILTKSYRRINEIWNSLTEPSNALVDIEDQRKSRLISSLIVISIVIFSIYIISFLFFDVYVLRFDFTGEILLYLISDSVSLFILVVIYFVSKSKYYYVSSFMFLIVTTGILLVNILIEDEMIFQVFFILALFSFLIIMTSLFFSTLKVTIGFLIYFTLFLIITTIIKPQDINVILLMSSFLGFQFLLLFLQNHYYYKRLAELELAINAKEDANKRAEFLNSLLTHDIANKIARVNGYLYLINRGELDEEQTKLLKQTMATCDEGAKLVNKINYIREIEESLGYSEQEVNLNEILVQVVNIYIDDAAKEGIEIIIDEEKGNLNVLGGELLKELFSNLIENSIHHSNGSLLKISRNRTLEKISVVIEDNGTGIPENITEVIFERGIKGDQSTGSGLGLFLVKTIIDNLNANILVCKSSLGGAKFIVDFML